MGQEQAVDPNAPLSDDFLKAHATDPDVMPYLTSDERRRLTRLTPQPLVRSRTGQMYDPNAAPPPDVGRFAERLGAAINPMTYVRMAQSVYDDPAGTVGAVLKAPIDLAGRVIGGDFSGAMGDVAGGALVGKGIGLARQAPAALGGAMTKAGAVADTLDPDLVAIASPRAGAALRKAQQVRDVVASRQVPSAESSADVAARAAQKHRPNPTPPSAPAEATASAAAPKTPDTAAPPRPSPPVESPHPTRTTGMMSPTAIQSDLGIAARRAKLTLTEAQYQQAESLVRKGQEPGQAVRNVAAGGERGKLSIDETKFYLAMKQAGKSDAQVIEMIRAARALNASLGLKTPTVAETKFPKGMRGGRNPMKPLVRPEE